jgi:HEAT repeat protein
MTTALGDPEHEVRYQVLMALERCDQPYFKDKDFLAALVPALIKALEFEDSSNILSSQFIAALGKTGDQRAIPVLQTILKTPEPENVDRFSVRPDKYTPRQEAARMLFTMGDKSLVPFWNNFTSDTDDVVVIWASAALCKSGDQVDEHLQKIGALLNESGVSGRIAAVEALKALNDKKAVPILVRYLRNQENIKCKPDVPAPRVTYSTDQNKEREDALTLLSDLGGKSVLEDLKWIMKEEKDGYVRRAAADAVTKWAGPDAETILIDCLPDPSPGVRFRICEILGVIGTSNAVTALQKVAINDPYKSEKGECDIREAARQSLKKLDIMSQKDRVDRVIAEANDEKSKLRQWAIEQLGNMKDDPKAEAALTALLKMPETKCSCGHYHYREAVAEILKKQGKNVVQKADGQYELAK